MTRCDACGAYIVPESGGHSGGAPRGAASPRSGKGASHAPAPRGGGGIPPWAFLVIGLVVGGAVGYALRAAVAPRDDSGMATGPADIMAGATGAGAPAGGMEQTQMLPGVIEALGKYRTTLASDPTNVEANVGIGNLMFDSGKWDQAIEHYSTALDKDPTLADVRVDRAIAYHTIGQNDKALAEMKRVTKEKPDHKNAWLNMGVVAGALGDRKTNIEAWETYLKLEPTGPHSDAIRGELAKVKAGS
ncbi:MAG TPA: tetratricopeptide repeat protein [Candidatus Eisenbacteria bacterium]|nr:tetratricopeptide repeat protein [Candidatus Eisenbacteria bacterium]